MEDNPKNQMLSIGELSMYLPGKPSYATIYMWIRKGLIPYYFEATYFFRKDEITGWLSLLPPQNRK